AIYALQRRLAAKLVAAGAVGGPVQRLVGPGERSGRNLGRNLGRYNKETAHKKGEPKEPRPGVPLRGSDPFAWRWSIPCFQYRLAVHHAPREISSDVQYQGNGSQCSGQ